MTERFDLTPELVVIYIESKGSKTEDGREFAKPFEAVYVFTGEHLVGNSHIFDMSYRAATTYKDATRNTFDGEEIIQKHKASLQGLPARVRELLRVKKPYRQGGAWNNAPIC